MTLVYGFNGWIQSGSLTSEMGLVKITDILGLKLGTFHAKLCYFIFFFVR